MFGVEKPIIALLHLDALPGDPGYCGDMKTVTEHARKDLLALQDGGVDGILFANEFSLPYQPVADIAVVSAMAYIIGKLKDEISVPFGVNVVKNPIATIDLGAATGAKFGRSCFSGAYMGEYGVYVSNSGEAIRHRKALGIEDMKLLFKVNLEADAYLVQRDVQVVAKSIQDAKASGMLFGLKGTHTRKQINRAALEAVGYSTLQHMILFDEMNLPPKSVITAGGGTKNAAWMQIICDMIGRQICIPKRYQCSAYGDAAMAALGDRRFRDFTELRDSLPKGKILVPNEKNHIYYKEHYKMFRDLYLNNKDMMHRI
jgi:membrane complex biogenesis BtpA family protein